MKLYQTKEGTFIKRLGKVYWYVGDAFVEIPILTARQIAKLREKVQKAEEADES